jgi:hypothetical protein
MGAFLNAVQSATKPLVWLDPTDYAGGLLAAGAIPWLDCAALVAWRRKAQSLLRSDVVALPLEVVCAEWLAGDAQLKGAMAAKQRVLHPLKALLADVSLRSYLLELARSLRASFAGLPFALVAPSPRAWAGRAYTQTHGAPPDIAIGDEEVESAATYVADFLRTFADCAVDALLLEESLSTQSASREGADLYQPAFNVAAHYRWDIGLHLPADRDGDLRGGAAAFAVAPRARGIPTGLMVPAGFWSGESLPGLQGGDFRYAAIPRGAEPECVLERVALLRESA